MPRHCSINALKTQKRKNKGQFTFSQNTATTDIENICNIKNLRKHTEETKSMQK